jgi:hypothetical protein
LCSSFYSNALESSNCQIISLVFSFKTISTISSLYKQASLRIVVGAVSLSRLPWLLVIARDGALDGSLRALTIETVLVESALWMWKQFPPAEESTVNNYAIVII